MFTLLLFAAGLYGAAVLLAALFQARLLFPSYAVAPAEPLPASATRLTLAAPDGVELRGVHLPPAVPGTNRLLVLVFPGNGWNAEDAALLVHRLWPEADTIAFHYRGYAPSGGDASAKALLADAPLLLATAKERVRPARTIAVGFSIGSGVAASLARRRWIDGAILVTPFDRLRAVAKAHYRWLPVDLFFRHDIDAAADLQQASAKVALISAGQDRIIPPARTAGLRRAVRHLAYDHVVPGAGHNDIYTRAGFARAMDEALAAVLAPPARKS